MAEKKIPYIVPAESFPEAPELPEGAVSIRLKDTFGYGVEFKSNEVYINRTGMDLHLQIMIPRDGKNPDKKWPLVVFVQGSAWHKQDVLGSLPVLLRMCQRGYAIAIVEYRPSETAPFPAQMQDAKTAVRFMKKNAENYRIDPERVAVWGDSSGGHTAMMVGFTGDTAPDTEDYGEYSAQVRCIVDWYGPTDIEQMNYHPSVQDHAEPDSPEGWLIGRKNVLENKELAKTTSPMEYLSADRETPPVLMMHGGSDLLVPFHQACLLYEKLKDLGKEAEFYKLEYAGHGYGGFQSEEALDLVEQFLKKYL